MNDPYDLLEVRRSCTASELKQAYKKMALLYHPDKNSFDGTNLLKKGPSKLFLKLLPLMKIFVQAKLGSKKNYGNSPDIHRNHGTEINLLNPRNENNMTGHLKKNRNKNKTKSKNDKEKKEKRKQDNNMKKC